MMRMTFLSLAVLAAIGSISGLAQEPVGDKVDAQQKWNSLPEPEKERIRQNYRSYIKMSPAQKEELDKKYEVYRKLPESEKARIQKNWAKFKALPAEQQKKIQSKAQSKAQGNAPEHHAEKHGDKAQKSGDSPKRQDSPKHDHSGADKRARQRNLERSVHHH